MPKVASAQSLGEWSGICWSPSDPRYGQHTPTSTLDACYGSHGSTTSSLCTSFAVGFTAPAAHGLH